MSMNIKVDEFFLLYSWEHERMRGNWSRTKNKINGKYDDWDINIGFTINGA